MTDSERRYQLMEMMFKNEFIAKNLKDHEVNSILEPYKAAMKSILGATYRYLKNGYVVTYIWATRYYEATISRLLGDERDFSEIAKYLREAILFDSSTSLRLDYAKKTLGSFDDDNLDQALRKITPICYVRVAPDISRAKAWCDNRKLNYQKFINL